ncbi:DUF2812 domain-containing protein [Macrococcus equi]|uniref:DUF2812 domain-containing protein n=1 Tax=Macrococcus equi TaxID=3395462 RepID=UPI0039BE5CBD
MEKVVRKFFLLNSYEQEERWLNQMANQGYLLKGVSLGKYTFEQTNKNYIIRLVYMPEDTKDFITFVEETGGEYIDSLNQWGYFCKEVSNESDSFEIYSDLDSKIEQNKRILNFALAVFWGLTIAMICGVFLTVQSDTISVITKSIASIVALVIVLLYVFILINLSKRNNKLKKERELQE